jgi:DNA-binding LytR/AlgR family response regulator
MYNCLIIEDEPLAAEILSDYIREVSDFHLVGVCRDVVSAAEYLRSHSIDVLFVDIHLPKIKGIDFVRTIQNKYQVILTTAYDQYAIEGYNLNVTDYLLKPIEFSRFLQAIQKVTKSDRVAATVATTQKDPFHFFNVDKKQVKVYLKDIDYVESLKDYIKIHTGTKYIVTKLQIGELDSLLSSANLFRIHKSFMINLDKVTAYSASHVEIGGQEIPIGRSYKELVMKQLKG